MDFSRRDFVKAAAFGAAAGSLGRAAAMPAAAADPKGTGSLTFCAFADIHYFPQVFPHDTREWLERVLARAEAEKCEMVVHMGDFCHTPHACRDYADFYNDFHLPCYHTLGNHDDDGNLHEQTLDAYRLERGYYHFDRGGFRFVVTDTNNFCVDGVWSHYSKSNYYKVAKAVKRSTSRVDPQQLEWMKDVIGNSPYPCIVTSHASYERPVGGSCPDGAAVRKIFNDANAKHPGRVRLVINGHHHEDNVRVLDDIVYFDLNTANYKWMDKAHTAYPADWKAKWRLVDHTLMFEEPISAIVTISQDGRIRVKGQKSRFALGITPEQAKCPVHDGCGRLTTPDIQSFDLKMSYGNNA